jgi:hypothetical protein
MHFGSNDILAAACIGFRDNVALERAQRATASLENHIRDSIPAITRAYLSLSTRPAKAQEPATR